MSDTVLDRLVGCVDRALEYDRNVRVAPLALLWPDEAEQWTRVIDRVGEHVPVLSLGDYDPRARRGPAYWIRCVLARTIDIGLPDCSPVVYLPGVPREALRAAENCAPELAPIAELQYRSEWFSNPKGRDWTVPALLSHREQGLGLDVARDAETRSALGLALDRLLDEPIDHVRHRTVDAEYLLELVNDDPVWSLLQWLGDPQRYRSEASEQHWKALIRQCKADYGFDPSRHGEISAAQKLGACEGKWAKVWKRFAATPERFPGVPEQLRKARPKEILADQSGVWPQDNEQEEAQLRSRLRDFSALTPEGARKEIAILADEHAWRRRTVWAALGQAPLAFAVEQLAGLGEVTKQPLAGGNIASLVADYTQRGWHADDAILRALSSAGSREDREAVAAAASALYREWLDQGARALQSAVSASPDVYEPGKPVSATPGTVTVFVDGLRLDVSHRVRQRLSDTGLEVAPTTTLSALPTVTATAKPALVPAADGALTSGPELSPVTATTGAKASVQVLRKVMSDVGVQILGATDAGDPAGAAWTEAGQIDRRGHELGVRLADCLDEEIRGVVARVRELLDAGWQRAELVTDHGWVLLPDGMEKVELPYATTEVKKGRCARLKQGAVVGTPTAPWSWDRDVRIALAPGATSFEANQEYEHGGVSPQECIVPRLTVTAAATQAGGPEFTKIKWLGLQCRIEFTGTSEKMLVDLRGLPRERSTSIALEAKETSSARKVSLLARDDQEGEAAHLVLTSPDGELLAQREVVVGRNR